MEENTNRYKEEPFDNDDINTDMSILQWDSHKYHLMAMLCWVVGLANSWRFSVAYNVDNGAFLLPYIIQIILISIPMTYMEMGLGQFSNRGPLSVWKMCPMLKGISYGSTFVLIIFMVYYNTICSYFLFFLIASIDTILPWSVCDSSWAEINCFTYELNISIRLDCARIYKDNFCQHVEWQNSASHYWVKRVLHLKTNGEFGTISMELLCCSAFTAFLVFLFNCKGTRSLKKVIGFLTIFPYIEIVVLMFVVLTHPGSGEGVRIFFSPQFKKLLDISCWRSSFEQCITSVGVGLGGFFMLGSQCHFRNACHVNAIVLNVIDVITSLCYAIIYYSLLGCLSRGLNIPIEEIQNWKDNLMFENIPFSLLFLPYVKQIWAAMLFSSIYLLGLRSESMMMATILNTIYEAYPETTSYSILWSAICSFLMLILGYPNLSQLGSILVSSIDNIIAGPALALVCVFESIGIVYIYGITHFVDDMHFMLGFRPSTYWLIIWTLLPIILAASFVSSFHNFIENEVFKPPWLWLRALQWCVLSFPLILLIIGIISCYLEKRKKRKLLKLFELSSSWGPTDLILRKSRNMFTAHSMTKEYLYRQNRLKSTENDDTDETFYM